MNFRFNAACSASILLVVSSVLAACSNSEPNISDSEIIALLGSQPMFGSKAASPTISKEITECSELISGSKDDVVKDMPADFIGQMKTGCREKISSLLKDPTKNNFGLTLSNFENKNFATRLSALKNSIDIANSKAEIEAKAKEKAASQLKAEAELTKMTSDYKAFVVGLDEQLSKTNALCGTLKNALTEFKAATKEKGYNEWVFYDRPQICAPDRQIEIKTKSQEILATLQTTQIMDSFMGATFSKPYLGYADPQDIKDQIERVNSDIEKITNDLNKLKK